MILIVTNKNDLHADAVIDWLELWNKDYFRFHPDELATRYEVTTYDAGTPEFYVLVTDTESGRSFRSDLAESVWNRRGLPPRAHPQSDPGCAVFFAAELDASIQLIYSSLAHCLWINRADAITRANDKLQQLQTAALIGLRVPETKVTNSPREAFDFYCQHDKSCIVKTFRQALVTGERRLFTHKLGSMLTLESFSDIISAPVILQRFIDKEYDLRITVVGEDVYACRIHSQDHESSKVDFRATDTMIDEICHELIDIPSSFKTDVLKFSRSFGLESCELDFVETENGKPIFLECNPNGQWLWIEILCRADIAKSMASLLSRGT